MQIRLVVMSFTQCMLIRSHIMNISGSKAWFPYSCNSSRWSTVEGLQQLQLFTNESCYEVFVHDVTVTMLGPKEMEWRPCWCPRLISWEFSFFVFETCSIVLPITHGWLSRLWKHFIVLDQTLYQYCKRVLSVVQCGSMIIQIVVAQ